MQRKFTSVFHSMKGKHPIPDNMRLDRSTAEVFNLHLGHQIVGGDSTVILNSKAICKFFYFCSNIFYDGCFMLAHFSHFNALVKLLLFLFEKKFYYDCRHIYIKCDMTCDT